MSEKWLRWDKVEIPRGEYELNKLEQNYEGVYIVLDDDIHKITISFEPCVLALRACDEGDRWRTIGNVLGQEGGDYFVGKPIYTVMESEFTRWYNIETFNDDNDIGHIHYAIVTRNDIIDILSMTEPMINVNKIIKGEDY